MLEISPGLGSALSGLFTMSGAIIGILLANSFFKNRIKTLKDALDEAQILLANHATATTDTLARITERIAVLDTQSSGLQSTMGRIESTTSEIAEEIADHPNLDQAGGTDATDAWHRVRGHWLAIRDELEMRASSDAIDGRTRAAYGRIDRRSYPDLIDKMRSNDDVTDANARRFREAFDIWQRHKTGRRALTAEVEQAMVALRDVLVRPANS